MSKAIPRSDRRTKHRTKDTYSFYLERRSLELVEALVQRGVYANASHAVDEAVVRLLDQHRVILTQIEEATDARAA